jgi:hypothetical protein
MYRRAAILLMSLTLLSGTAEASWKWFTNARQEAERGNRLFDALLDGYLSGLRDVVYAINNLQERYNTQKYCIPKRLSLNRQTLLELIDKGEAIRIALAGAKIPDDHSVLRILEFGLEDVFPCSHDSTRSTP